MYNLIALFIGACMPLAFAPFYWWWLAPLVIAVLVGIRHAETPITSAVRSLFFGIGYFTAGIAWIYISIHVYGNTPSVFAALITGLFILILTLFPIAQGYFLQKFFFKTDAVKTCIVFPTTWALLEWTRSYIFSGFPWLLAADTTVPYSPLAGFLPLIGQWGTGFLVALVGALLFQMYYRCHHHRTTISIVIALCVLFGSGTLLKKIVWTTPVHKPYQVALVQGNIPQQIKWDPEQAKITLDTYRRLTHQHWQSDWIVWPEAAIPMLKQDAEDYIHQLSKEAFQHHSSLIIGVPILEKNQYFNGIITLGENSNGHYYKRHLVPFGEYVPLEFALRGLIGFFNLPMSNFTPGLLQAPLSIQGVPIGVFICYEIAYSNIVYDIASASQVLMVLSNDAWFGDSLAPAQHLQIAQVQALKTGKPLLFVSNTGITASINENGVIIARLPQFKEGVLTGAVQPRSGNTPWSRWGDTPVLIILLGLLLLSFYLKHRKKS